MENNNSKPAAHTEARRLGLYAPPCSAFWWIEGTVIGDEGRTIYPARKHKFFRYVEAWSWGKWNGIREEYPEIPKSFQQNAGGEASQPGADHRQH